MKRLRWKRNGEVLKVTIVGVGTYTIYPCQGVFRFWCVLDIPDPVTRQKKFDGWGGETVDAAKAAVRADARRRERQMIEQEG